MTMIHKERLEEITKLVEGKGDLEKGLCIMQAVDYVTSGGISDHPECACPALTAYAIQLNDDFDHEARQLLLPLISKLAGTRDGKTKERAEFLVFHSITKTFPIFVEFLGLKEDAEKLAAFQPGEFVAMQKFCEELRPRLRDAAQKKYAANANANAAAAAYAAVCVVDAYAYAAATVAATVAATANAAARARAAVAIKKEICASAIEGLRLACEIKEKV